MTQVFPLNQDNYLPTERNHLKLPAKVTRKVQLIDLLKVRVEFPNPLLAEQANILLVEIRNPLAIQPLLYLNTQSDCILQRCTQIFH